MRNSLMGLCVFLLTTTMNTLAEGVQPYGIAFVEISAPDITIDIPVAVCVFHSFPLTDYSIAVDTLAKSNVQIVLKCPIRVTQVAQLELDNFTASLKLRPGDTIRIVVSGIPTDRAFTFAGNLADIQYYYLEKAKRFPIDIRQLMLDAGGRELTLSGFQQVQDSLASVERRFWDEMKTGMVDVGGGRLKRGLKLPDWFVRYETDAMRYHDAHRRLYAISYREFVLEKKESIPESYLSFLRTFPVRNEKAMYDPEYVAFLRAYIYHLAGSPRKDYLVEEVRLAQQILGERVGSFYLLSSIG